MPCPNKTLDSWKSLVAALGSEAKALAVYTLNNYDIPSIEEAKLLLRAQEEKQSGKVKNIKADLKELKLNRINEQIDTLDRIMKSAPKDARLETIKKLKANLQEYRKVIEQDQSTVSVSNLFAGGELEDQEKYKDYAEFGTFQHYILESLQKETLGTDKSLTSVFTKKKLQELLDSYPNKFTIKGLIDNGTIANEEELFNMSMEVLGVLQNYTSMGYTVLPEITVFGKDRFDRNIVGRLDLLAINKNGSVAVIDLKSKKLKSTASADSLAYFWPVNSGPQTDAEFRGGTRNTYENWDIQLGIYARMLQQLGILTDEKRILGLYYYGAYSSLEGKQFTDKGEDTFSYQFYRVKSYASSEFDKAGESDYLRYKSHMRKIAKVLPLAEEDVTPVREKDKDEFAFNLSKEESDKLVDKLKEISNKEISSARTKLSEARKKDSGREIIKYYEERIESLEKIRKALDQGNWESAYKIGFVIRTLDVDLKNLSDTVFKLKKYSDIEGFANSIKDLEKLNRTAQGYRYVINQVSNLLSEAGVPNDSKALAVIDNINRNINRVKSEYTRLGSIATVKMLADSLGEMQIERIDEQKKQLLGEKIKYLTKRKQKLEESGQETGFWHRVSNPVKNIVNSTFRQDLNPQNELEHIEQQIFKLEVEMQGVKLDDDSIKKYLEGILDPTSPVYIGQGTSFFTQVMAGSSSADWLNSAYATKLKIALSNGTQEFVNFVEREKIQDEFNAYKAGERNVDKLNEPISEIRKVKMFDMEGNESTVERRAFVNPVSQAYYDIIDTYRNEYRKLKRQLNEADDIQKKEIKSKLKDLVKAHTEWRLENTHMEYVSEIYELDKLLPEEYKQERDELYEEKRLLENSAGFNNAEDLDESTIYRIAEIEVELNKLRKKYADMREGGYARYLDLQEKYYDYEINYNYFDRLYNQKKIELSDINGNVDVEALAKWKTQNMIKRPKEEWYELVGEIWDDIFMIIGKENPAIAGLKEKYKEILKQYRRRGAVDSRFMSQEDIDVLTEIEKLIQTYKTASPSRGLTYEDRLELTELFKSLEAIQTRVENPFYIQEFSSRLDELELAWNNYQVEKDESRKEMFLEQFLLKEMDFKTWYDNNHTNKYVSKLVSNEALNPLPKKYNMMTIPTSEDMMEEVPDYKFTQRILKPIAFNLNYEEDALGYPMPKGLSRDRAEVIGNSPWLNPKYEQIRSSPKVSKFYHSFVGRFLDMQQQTTGKLLGYNFPGYEQKSLDDIRNKGIKDGVKSRIKLFKDKNLAIGTDYDFSINGYGTSEEDRIQFKHNTPLPIEQQTTDGIAAVIRWYEQAYVNKSMAEQQAISKSIIIYIESLYDQLANSAFEGKEKRMREISRVIDQLKFEYKKHIKGEWKEDQGLAGRFGDLALSALGFTRLALDIPNQIGNMFSGNVQAFLATHKSGLFTSRNYLWAKTKIESKNGLIGSLISDYGKIGNKSFMTKMLLYWNPLQESLDHYYNRTRSTGDRLKQGFAEGKFSFWIQDKGELEIGSTIWLSIMDNVKVKVVKNRDDNGNVTEYEKDENGNIKTVNVFEAYTQNSNGEIIIRPDVEWSKKQEESVQKMVWSEIRRTQGRYAEWDKAKIEAGFFGRLLLFYRKYLEPAIKNRFGNRQPNYEAGEMTVGMYRALIDTIKMYNTKQFILAVFGSKNSGVSEAYQAKSQMAMRELAVATAMYIMGRMLVSALPDDDDDDKTLARTLAYNMMAVYAKVDMETRSLVPMIVIGGLDNYLENLSSFTNAGRDLVRIGQMLEHGFFLGLAQMVDNDSEWGEYVNKNAYYQRKTKLFDKGDAKVKKDIMAITGYMNYFELFNPEDRIKNYKSQIN